MEDPSEQAQLRRGIRPSYIHVLDSDVESSTDESKPIRSGDATSPSEPYKDTEKSPEYFPESDYEAGKNRAGVKTSIKTQSDHHETARKPVASQYEVDWTSVIERYINRPYPWKAESKYGTGLLRYPVYAANHQHLNSHSVQAPDPGRMNKDQLAQPLFRAANHQHLNSHSVQAPDPGWMNKDLLAQPLFRASWAGDFAISAKNPQAEAEARCGGLKGCLSVKACAEARWVVERMPPTIRWEKVPKHCVWFFERWGPNVNDIAVYFFPSLTRHESAYDSLVMELVRDDLALKTRVMGSELLLFTSVELPTLFTRFQGKLYLWGVFRGNRPQL